MALPDVGEAHESGAVRSGHDTVLIVSVWVLMTAKRGWVWSAVNTMLSSGVMKMRCISPEMWIT